MSDGTVWIGTNEGHIVALNSAPPDPADHSSDPCGPWSHIIGPERTGGAGVRAMLETVDGDVWVSLLEGALLRFDGSSWLRLGPGEGVTSEITALHQDHRGGVWAAGLNRLYRLDGTRLVAAEHWHRGLPAREQLYAQARAIASSPDGELLIGTRVGVRTRGPTEWPWLTLGPEIGNPNVRAICLGPDGSVWVGTREGLIRGYRSAWTGVARTAQGHTLSSSSLCAALDTLPMCADHKNGISVFQGGTWQPLLPLPEVARWITRPVASRAWALGQTQAIQFSAEDRTILRHVPLPREVETRSLFQASSGAVWLLTRSGLHKLADDRFQPVPDDPDYERAEILGMDEASDGSLYVATGERAERWTDDGIERLGDAHPELRSHHFSAVCCTRDGRVWIGTYGTGLFVLDGTLVTEITHRDGLISNQISRIYESSDGTMWIAYRRKGVASYRNGRWVHFTHRHGLPNARITRIGESPKGTIWLSTERRGLFRYEPDPQGPDTRIPAPPGEIASHGVGVFTFSGQDAWRRTPQEDLEFSWRIVPSSTADREPPWSPFSQATSIVTPRLRPGAYRLEVRTADDDRNIDPTPASVSFRVAPPFWARTAFLAPVVLLSVIAAGLFVGRTRKHAALRRSQAALQASRNVLELRVTERTRELQARNRQLQQAMSERKRRETRIECINRLREDLLLSGTLDEKLKRITDGIVRIFDADFARIWVARPGDLCDAGCFHAQIVEGPHVCRHRDRCLHLIASSGRYTHLDGKVHRRVPFACYKIGRVAAGEDPKFVTNDAQHDSRVHDQDWARSLGLVSFAGYRLLSAEGEPIGVLALFSKHTVTPHEDALLEGLTGTTAHVIQTATAEAAACAAQDELLERQRSETERTQAELAKVRRQLVSQTRLATIGQVAASIAHELRNPLGAVRNAAYYLKRRTAGQHPTLREYLDLIDQEIASANRVIQNMIEMARPKEPINEPVDLARTTREIRERVCPDGEIECQVIVDPDPFLLYADADQLRQVLNNLLTNAAQAMKGAGRITVEARRSSDCDTITIRDTGPGVAAEHRDQLFEPLYTTKAKGTGLGLTICRQIIERHGGTIDLVDSARPGATFRIRLPRAPQPAPITSAT